MKPKHHTHLSLSERRQIYVLLGRKVPLSQIATILGRHHSTIYREFIGGGSDPSPSLRNQGSVSLERGFVG
jgi:IS30 family transposase